ncbi:winged helix-turn-helix domain-containing protein [Corynebacterium lehmanniae]|uniref:winged helix-turn-helix domain-containing protein n=1 Tax=Corynebacterium haemomassiliense TaxID=2754726 RepID=UPI00370D7D97
MNGIPAQMDLPWPVIHALQQLGGSGSIEEIDSEVIANEGFDEKIRVILHGSGPRTEIQYRLAWARTYLKNAGLVVNSKRGIWALTEVGRDANEESTNNLVATWKRRKDAGVRPTAHPGSMPRAK